MDRYLICESAQFIKRQNEKVLPDKVIFDAIIQTVDTKNRNGRVYTKDAIDNALKMKMEMIGNNSRGFLGELDHPDVTGINDPNKIDARLSNVLWDRVCIVITKTWWKGNELWATIESTLTGKGPEIVKIVKDKIPLGFSLRAIAEGRRNSDHILIDKIDYIVSYDAVTTPSHKEALMRKLNEERFYNITESLKINQGIDLCCKLNIDNNNNKLTKQKLYDLLLKWG